MASDRDLKKRLELAAPQLGATDVWLPKLLEMDKSRLVEALRKDLFQIGELALKATASGKTQQAVNWLVLGFYCDPAAAREAMASAGTLRASKYRYRTRHLLKTLAGLDAAAGDLGLSGEILAYLNSVKILIRLAPAVAHMDESLRGFLKRHGKTALKAVVARMDALFMIALEADPAGDTDEITTYPREELGEAASYIIHCIDEEIGIEETHFGLMPEDEIVKGVFDKILVKACRIRKYREAELLVDAFDYQCSATGRTVSVSAPTPKLEKSIRLGYIQDEQAREQTRLTRVKAMQQGAPSVFALADEFFDRFHDSVVKRLDVPVSRYAFHLPEAPPIKALFQGEAITVEEDFYLREVGNIELVTWDELKRVGYGSGLTLLDLARVHRLFLFFARLARRQLEPLLKTEPALTYRSLIQFLRKQI